jgi:hypothetical protein
MLRPGKMADRLRYLPQPDASASRSKIVGDIDQITIGTEIEVTGSLIDGLEPPLIVADTVRLLIE